MVAEWLSTEPAELPILRIRPNLRVWLGHLMKLSELRGMVIDQRTWLEQRLANRTKVPRDQDIAGDDVVIRWEERRSATELNNSTTALRPCRGELGRQDHE